MSATAAMRATNGSFDRAMERLRAWGESLQAFKKRAEDAFHLRETLGPQAREAARRARHLADQIRSMEQSGNYTHGFDLEALERDATSREEAARASFRAHLTACSDLQRATDEQRAQLASEMRATWLSKIAELNTVLTTAAQINDELAGLESGLIHALGGLHRFYEAGYDSMHWNELRPNRSGVCRLHGWRTGAQKLGALSELRR